MLFPCPARPPQLPPSPQPPGKSACRCPGLAGCLLTVSEVLSGLGPCNWSSLSAFDALIAGPKPTILWMLSVCPSRSGLCCWFFGDFSIYSRSPPPARSVFAWPCLLLRALSSSELTGSCHLAFPLSLSGHGRAVWSDGELASWLQSRGAH